MTLRIADGLPRLRRARAFRVLRQAIAGGHRTWFRVVHSSVMTNHLHLIVEADDRQALARGMQGLKIRMARGLNRIWQRKGSVFSERYHAAEIGSPTQARNTLLYVLNNARKHAGRREGGLPRRWVDPFSSARQLDGWQQPVQLEEGVVEAPRSWLLRSGWRKRGLLDAHAVPTRGPPGGS